jgi:GMP synthase (glutamine-hydrolysing)
MGANDTLDWVRRAINWLEVPLGEDKPILGLCLGAQILSARLARGCLATTISAARSVITQSSPRRRVRFSALSDSHASSTNGIPTASIYLKVVSSWLLGGEFPQPSAYRYSRHAVGLQFHPEVTYHMICRRTHPGAERQTRPGAFSRREHLAGWFQHDGRITVWLEEFLPGVARGTPGGARAEATSREPS